MGQYDIVLDGSEEPLAIIQNIKVKLVSMNQVTAAFASLEGEGDLSLAYWYDVHQKFFRAEFETAGLEFTPAIKLVCETFKVVDLFEQ